MGEIIYHYCGGYACLEILKSKKVWLTNTAFLNDYNEVKLFCDMVVQEIDTLLNSVGEPEREFMTGVMSMLGQALPRTQYCCCLSEDPDMLTQWCLYADDGVGFTIGFDKSAIEQYDTTSGRPVLRVMDVDYREERHQAEARSAASQIAEAAVKAADKDKAERATQMIYWMAAVSFLAPSFKNVRFEHEREVRIVYDNLKEIIPDMEHPRVKGPFFRWSKGTTIPYCELAVDPSSLRSIGFGPKNDRDRNQAVVGLLLAENGFDRRSIDLYSSEATYR